MAEHVHTTEFEFRDARPRSDRLSSATRREMLEAAGGAGLLAIAAAAFTIPERTLPHAIPPRGADAQLVALSSELVSLERERRLIGHLYAHTPVGTPTLWELGARKAAMQADCNRLARQVGQLPTARSPDGVRARAAALRAVQVQDDGDGPDGDGELDLIRIDWHQGLLDALMRDLGVDAVLDAPPAVAL